MDELTIGDETYISSKRAAAITGYAKDYVGQLCREGHVKARMVGRSWYVLESSIREHRFGAQEEQTKPAEVQMPPEPEVSLPVTWEPSTYISEPTPTIPTITSAPRAEMPPQSDVSDDEPALDEMQAAWKEWFETRKEVASEQPEEVIEDEEQIEEEIEAEEAVPLPIQRIQEPPRVVEEDRVSIKRVPEPVVIVSAPIQRRPQRKSRAGANLVVIALLVVLAGASVAIAFINTGYASQYLTENSVVRFLGGTSTINK